MLLKSNLPQPENRSVIYNGKTVDTLEKLPQTHICMESEYILIVLEMCAHLSKISVIKRPCVYYFTIIYCRAVLSLWQHWLFMLSIKS
jgi:hypothetical protein